MINFILLICLDEALKKATKCATEQAKYAQEVYAKNVLALEALENTKMALTISKRKIANKGLFYKH